MEKKVVVLERLPRIGDIVRNYGKYRIVVDIETDDEYNNLTTLVTKPANNLPFPSGYKSDSTLRHVPNYNDVVVPFAWLTLEQLAMHKRLEQLRRIEGRLSRKIFADIFNPFVKQFCEQNGLRTYNPFIHIVKVEPDFTKEQEALWEDDTLDENGEHNITYRYCKILRPAVIQQIKKARGEAYQNELDALTEKFIASFD